MENASKALLMAAGVLIGILILSLIVYLFANFGMASAEVHKQKDMNDINSFNTQFTSYEGKECNIQDVISAVNLAIDNNKNYSLNAEEGNNYYITVNIIGNTNVRNLETKKSEDFNSLLKEESRKKYNCTTKINEKTQRVNVVNFKEN